MTAAILLLGPVVSTVLYLTVRARWRRVAAELRRLEHRTSTAHREAACECERDYHADTLGGIVRARQEADRWESM